jgi:hypothetical protein
MPRAKTPRTTKPKTSENVLQMPENGNGNASVYTQHYSPADLEAEIRLRAFELFEQRGCEPGRDAQDWLAAEREVRDRHADQKHTA